MAASKMNSVQSPCPSKFVRRIILPLFLPLIYIIHSFTTVMAETYKVLRVVDGDTITILNIGQKQSIRLVGINMPVRRVLDVVYVGESNTNLEMLRKGYAEVYRGRPDRRFDSELCRQPEVQAKSKKLNIWSVGGDYVSPKESR